MSPCLSYTECMKDKTKKLTPIVKWPGGKRKLTDILKKELPQDGLSSYCEPFAGGCAFLLALRPEKAVVSDTNEDLINLYNVVKTKVDDLIYLLKTFNNDERTFYELRGLDRDHAAFNSLSPVEKAVRFLFLNKTCFNGLYRVNKKGEFNAPFGHYKNPKICDEENLHAVSKFLNTNDITFLCQDFQDALRGLRTDTFVYLDPPYVPVSKTSSFTAYSKKGFDKDDQIRLKRCCDELTRNSIKFMLSNSDTEFTRELYSEYNIVEIDAQRSISAKTSGRGKVKEVVVKNY